MDGTLADRIAADLRASLPPGETSLSALARRYGVSLTPVRQAADRLVAEGLLERTATGRLRRPGDARAGADFNPVHVARDWEAALRRDALERSLRGDTSFWREEALAARVGVGRTALRQVLHRMAGEGFVEHVPRRGWRARDVGVGAVADYLRVREALERLALTLALPRLEPATLTALRDANADGGLDNRLHDYLIERAQSPLLTDFFGRYGVFWSALFDLAAPETHAEEAMAAQHRRILDALLAGDRESAAEALGEHIRAQQGLVEALLARLRATYPPESGPRATAGRP